MTLTDSSERPSIARTLLLGTGAAIAACVVIGIGYEIIYETGKESLPAHPPDPNDFILTSEVTPGLHTIDPGNLSEQDKADLIRVGQDAFGQFMPPQEILDHITGHVTVFRDGAGHIIGFGATEIRGNEFYLGGIAVGQEYQGTGVAGSILDAELKDMVRGHHDPLTMRTQNELVERTTTARLNKLIASDEIQGFELQREYQPGLYGRQLAEKMPPPSPGSPYNQLDHGKGDAFKLIFKIKY